ncbi:MAG: hypothetical protein GY863_04545 [bacterium]|nr:hypothetical protein [bacterium]
MRRLKNSSVVLLVLIALLLLSTAVFAQEKKAEDLEKKYAEIVGEFELDLSDMGAPVMTLTFYVEGGALWVDGGDGDPGEMEPVEDKEFEFIIEDPMNGTFELKFQKDENGKYNECLVINEAMMLEATAVRIDGGQ